MKLSKENKKSNNNNILVMQAVIFQPILLMCLKGVPLHHLRSVIQDLIPISDNLIKKYLFYLIEYDLIEYNGENRLYRTSQEGIRLLFKVEHKKYNEKLCISDILLYVE